MTRATPYRGRLAPSPTGHLHLGHARTFWTAQQRVRAEQGTLVLRNEDLDRARCRPEFVTAMYEDLRWFGFDWQEGPDVSGLFAPIRRVSAWTFIAQLSRNLNFRARFIRARVRVRMCCDRWALRMPGRTSRFIREPAGQVQNHRRAKLFHRRPRTTSSCELAFSRAGWRDN